MAPDTLEPILPALKEPTLLRHQCYVDGGWADADSGATRTVTKAGEPLEPAAGTRKVLSP